MRMNTPSGNATYEHALASFSFEVVEEEVSAPVRGNGEPASKIASFLKSCHGVSGREERRKKLMVAGPGLRNEIQIPSGAIIQRCSNETFGITCRVAGAVAAT